MAAGLVRFGPRFRTVGYGVEAVELSKRQWFAARMEGHKTPSNIEAGIENFYETVCASREILYKINFDVLLV